MTTTALPSKAWVPYRQRSTASLLNTHSRESEQLEAQRLLGASRTWRAERAVYTLSDIETELDRRGVDTPRRWFPRKDTPTC